MRIDIWSDLVCPFCLIGKVELSTALSRFEHRDDVTIALRSYELDPEHGSHSGPMLDRLVSTYGLTREQAEKNCVQVADRAASVGLEYNWQAAVDASTFDAHRLVKAAAVLDLGPAVEAALMTASFTHGEDLSDHATLTGVVSYAGLDEQRAAAVLASDAHADDVRADEMAARQLGISGVPFFLIDGTYGVSGAQSADTFTQALTQVWALTHPA